MLVPDLAKRLTITAPTVRSRIKSLQGAGLLKIAGHIGPEALSDLSRLSGQLEKVASWNR